MVNKVILLGNVGKDPEVRRMDNNLIVAQLSLATNEHWMNKEGKRETHTEWHNIVMWRGLAELAEKYIRKGSQIYVEGRLRTRSYDKDGNKHYVTEILANVVNLVGTKPDGQSASQASPEAQIPPIQTTALGSEPADNLPF